MTARRDRLKSDRLRKLETELQDLEQWLKLGLVPKKDIEKHKDEIRQVKEKVEEEVERLRFLKENGEAEEYVAPKRGQTRTAYDLPTVGHDMDMGGGSSANGAPTDAGGLTDLSVVMDTEAVDFDTMGSSDRPDEETAVEEDDDDPFSDRNRWRRRLRDNFGDDDEW
ncbi:MAG: hypothetical protein CMO81_07105 [Waddliaceae bacterium]|nr:hypothetical protein [Waddliaceae bacterium]